MKKSSCLYVGEIEHRRMQPVKHEFRYSVLYYFLDLDEVERIFRFPLLFSYNRPGILSFWRKDYMGDEKQELKACLQDYILQETGLRNAGKIRLLTNISYFGFCFNPVSFYYCYDLNDNLKFIVSEITNTPWGDRHRQLFTFEGDKKNVHSFPKNFHVSPFMPMSIDYTWVFENPAENLGVLMQNRSTGASSLIFDSTLELKREELTSFNILKFLVRFPFTTLKTMVAIYYQAALLYLKKVPFHPHPLKGESYDNSRASQR